ncbi:MAG: DUF4402 domain-containing protein [Micavibrio sp.]
MTSKRDTKTLNPQRSIKAGAAVVLVSLSAFGLTRAVAATATLPIIAQIVRAIKITVNTSLNFGTLAVTNATSPGTASIDPLTGKLTVDSKGGLAFSGGTPTAGRVIIKGAALPVNVTIASPTMQIHNGPESLTVENFKLINRTGGPRATVTPFGPGSSIAINVGASITSRPGQVDGVYTGTNTLYANYQ